MTGSRPRRLPSAAVPAAAAVACQICYPLLSGSARRVDVLATVLLFVTASLWDAARAGGRGTALRLLLVAGGTGLAAEAVGVATGVPFGRYHYTGYLGPQVLGVPLAVPLAWTMMAYPSLLVGRSIAAAPAVRRSRVPRRAVVAGCGAWTLAAWDLFLDPQMVGLGAWTWADPNPTLPGAGPVPVGNTVGWLLVGALVTASLDAALPGRIVARPVPTALVTWTWLGSALAAAAFLGRPAVGAEVGAAMAVTVLPHLSTVLPRAPRRRRSPAGTPGPSEVHR